MDAQTNSHVRVVIGGRAAMRRIMREAVREAGMRLAADCSDAAKLVAAVARERPDLCLLDRDLPGDGLAATAAIATPTPTTRVLLVGGRCSPAEVRAARIAGATGAVPADIDAASLAAAVDALVREGR